MPTAPPVRVRRVRPGEGATLRRLRLAALADAPGAFASTWAQEAAIPAAEWERQAAARAAGGREATFVAVDGDGEPVGLAGGFRAAAAPGEVHLVSMWVAPVARGRGAGRALVDAVVGWAAATGAAEVALWVVLANAGAERLYRAAGFRPSGHRQPLPSDATLLEQRLVRRLRAPEVTVRPAVPGDEAAVADVHVRSWQVGYRGLLDDAFLDGLRPEQRAARYRFGGGPDDPATLLAVDAGRVLGFATTGPGELLGLYADPTVWGWGVGRRLVAAARAALAAAGWHRAGLWVLAGNTRAERFYRADGWLPDGARRTETSLGVALEELRYRRPLQRGEAATG